MTIFEQILALPFVRPPHEFGSRVWMANGGFQWSIDKASGKVYCTQCVANAMDGRGITIEAAGLRNTVSKTLLGDLCVCQHCGRARLNGKQRKPRVKKDQTLVKTIRAFDAIFKAMMKVG